MLTSWTSHLEVGSLTYSRFNQSAHYIFFLYTWLCPQLTNDTPQTKVPPPRQTTTKMESSTSCNSCMWDARLYFSSYFLRVTRFFCLIWRGAMGLHHSRSYLWRGTVVRSRWTCKQTGALTPTKASSYLAASICWISLAVFSWSTKSESGRNGEGRSEAGSVVWIKLHESAWIVGPYQHPLLCTLSHGKHE